MDETSFEQFLADAGPELTTRARSLPASQRTLHQQILRHFADTSHPPAPQTIHGWAADLGVDARAALTGLAHADLVEADPDSGQVRGAYPFTSEPRGYQADIDGDPSVQLYCAADALGIPALVGRDATITSRDPHSGTEVQVVVRPRRSSRFPPRTSPPTCCAARWRSSPAARPPARRSGRVRQRRQRPGRTADRGCEGH